MTAMATMATSQLVDALPMAELARMSPMAITMGPVTTGGKKRMTRLGAEHLEQRGKHQVQKPGARHAQAGVRQQVGLAVGRDGRIPGNESERRSQERRHLPLRKQMEQQRAHAGEQQRGGDGQTRQDRHQDRRAEHGEHVLQSEDRHLRRAELARIVNCIGAVLGPHGRRFLFAHLQPLISRPLRCRMLPRSVIRRARLREPLASCHKFAQCAMPKRPSAC